MIVISIFLARIVIMSEDKRYHLQQLIKEFDKRCRFGKYEGLLYSKMYKKDKTYCKWLLEQEWFDDGLHMSMIIKASKKLKKLD